jgi:predicted NUDIX family NTP pyrophosphohydrolase
MWVAMAAKRNAKQSAGLLMYRRAEGGLEVFLAHPGGPFFARKDEGVWTIPKGEPNPDEDLLACAIREFAEETGIKPAAASYRALGSVQQKGGKLVHCWAFEGAWSGEPVRSNTFEMEWPPRSGRKQTFPEIDRAAFFPLAEAERKLLPAQCAFLQRLLDALRE